MSSGASQSQTPQPDFSNRRKKPIVLLIFLLIILVLVALIPLIDGYLFKRKYIALLQTISSDTKTSISVKEYRLGWFSSYAKIYIASPNTLLGNLYAPASSTAMPEGMTIEQTIKHGPLVYDRIQGKLALVAAALQSDVYITEPNSLLNNPHNTQKMMHVDTLANWHGNFLNQIDMPGLFVQIPFIGKLTWQGLKGTIDVNTHSQHIHHIKSDLTISPIIVESNFGSLNVSNASFQSDLIRQPVGMWKGSQVLAIPSVMIDGFHSSSKTTNLKFSHTFGVSENNFYKTTMEIDFERIITPQITVSPASIKFSFDNLSVQGMHDFIQTSLPSVKLLNSIDTLIAKVITPNTIMTGDIKFGTNYGKFVFNARGYWPVNTGAFTHMENAIRSLNYESKIRVSTTLINHIIELIPITTNAYSPEDIEILSAAKPPKTISPLQSKTPLPPTAAEKMQAQIHDLMRKGYIIQEKEDYVSDIIYQQGVMNINGIQVLRTQPEKKPILLKKKN